MAVRIDHVTNCICCTFVLQEAMSNDVKNVTQRFVDHCCQDNKRLTLAGLNAVFSKKPLEQVAKDFIKAVLLFRLIF